MAGHSGTDRQGQMSDRDFTTTKTTINAGDRASRSSGVSSSGATGVTDTRPGVIAAIPLALRQWTVRQWAAAGAGTVVVGMAIGLSTVLIPNGWFGREIESVAWNYPVWIMVSVLSGMLFATYVRPRAISQDPDGTEPQASPGDRLEDRRESGLGMVGAVLGWFAVGCPVCNKIALIALGYTGALRWFAPFQPFLAVGAIAMSVTALALRLRGQIWCSIPTVRGTTR